MDNRLFQPVQMAEKKFAVIGTQVHPPAEAIFEKLAVPALVFAHP